jgi:hypothetical protein
MENYSLVYKTNSDTVIQIVTSEEEIFQVHEDLMWVEGPEVLEEGKTFETSEKGNSMIPLLYSGEKHILTPVKLEEVLDKYEV